MANTQILGKHQANGQSEDLVGDWLKRKAAKEIMRMALNPALPKAKQRLKCKRTKRALQIACIKIETRIK